MAEFPAFKLWTDAYLGDTTHLTTLEHGAYLLLLVTAWRARDNKLPDDDKLLARYTKLTPSQWARIKPIISQFFVIENGFWIQSRLMDEAAAVRQYRDKQAAAGKASALKRKGRHSTVAQSGCNQNNSGSNLIEPPSPSPSPKVEDTSVSSPPAPKPKARKTKLPQGWEPKLTAKAQSMVALWPAGKFEREVEKFIDHAASNGRTALDWQAAFRTWINNADEWMQGNGKQQSPRDNRDGLTRYLDEELGIG